MFRGLSKDVGICVKAWGGKPVLFIYTKWIFCGCCYGLSDVCLCSIFPLQWKNKWKDSATACSWAFRKGRRPGFKFHFCNFQPREAGQLTCPPCASALSLCGEGKRWPRHILAEREKAVAEAPTSYLHSIKVSWTFIWEPKRNVFCRQQSSLRGRFEEEYFISKYCRQEKVFLICWPAKNE